MSLQEWFFTPWTALLWSWLAAVSAPLYADWRRDVCVFVCVGHLCIAASYAVGWLRGVA